jgi:hypothetical protein
LGNRSELSEEVVVAPSGLFFNDVSHGMVKVYGVGGDEKVQFWLDEPPSEFEQQGLRAYE